MMPYFTALFFLASLLAILYGGLRASSRRLPIFFLYNALAVLTLGLAPSIAYLLQATLPAEKVLQPMPISASWYFSYVLPILVTIALGTIPWSKQANSSDQDIVQSIRLALQKQSYLPFFLLLYGILMYFSIPFLPGSLSQIGVFSSMVLWVGLLHLFFSAWSWKVKTVVLVLVSAFTLIKALQSTFFGDLFVWPLWMMLFLQTRYHWSKKTLVSVGGITTLCLALTLAWKYDYRERVMEGTTESYSKKILNTVKDWAKDPWKTQRWQQALDRFNQGNHLAQVYRWVPKEEPYARGETLILAIKASLIPRFFWPDKPRAGGFHIWYRFTGNPLSPNVSMNIGMPGEAYANFGPWLSPLVVFAWVRFLYFLYYGLRQLALRHYPMLWLWVPLIFYPLMDQENDLVTILNHAVKGTAFTLVFCWCLLKINRYLPTDKQAN
jgi:hypothetical protein